MQAIATDEITDSIALIEMHRQETQKESGLAVACTEALRKLQELLESETETQRVNGPGEESAANIAAVTREIQRVKQLAGAKKPAANFQRGRGGHGQGQGQQPAHPDGPRNLGKNKSRRNKGRRGHR